MQENKMVPLISVHSVVSSPTIYVNKTDREFV